MKVFLFFLGTAIRGLALNPGRFFYFHCYIAVAHTFIYLSRDISTHGFGLLFTLVILGPLLLLIYRGLPLDCLSYESTVNREISSS